MPFLATAFQNRLRVLIKSRPGAGKSDIVSQVVRGLNWDLLISHPAVSDPTDYKGMPAVIDGADGVKHATFLPFGDLEALINAKKPTVCFVDDLGQAPPAVQAALMQPLQARRINGHKISPFVVFAGATNDTTHLAGVSGLLEPVKSRWDTIVELDVHHDDWCLWALDNKMPPVLVAYIRFAPQNLAPEFKPTRELKNSPCPRTVAAVGRWLNAGVEEFDVIAGAVGEGWTIEFMKFLKMYKELVTPDEILLDPDGAKVPDQPDVLWAVSSAMARFATQQNAERVFRYLRRLPKEFEVCCVNDINRAHKAAPAASPLKTPAGVTWVTQNAGVLS